MGELLEWHLPRNSARRPWAGDRGAGSREPPRNCRGELSGYRVARNPAERPWTSYTGCRVPRTTAERPWASYRSGTSRAIPRVGRRRRNRGIGSCDPPRDGRGRASAARRPAGPTHTRRSHTGGSFRHAAKQARHPWGSRLRFATGQSGKPRATVRAHRSTARMRGRSGCSSPVSPRFSDRHRSRVAPRPAAMPGKPISPSRNR